MLQNRLPSPNGVLANYRLDDTHHDVWQRESAIAIWNGNMVLDFARDNRVQLERLVGGPVAVQAEPYLRIARPGARSDNIGLHRDADYGQNEEELTIHVAITPTTEEGCLRFMSGSHRTDERPYERHGRSDKERLGAPARMLNYLPSYYRKMAAPALKFGEAIAFNPKTIHGQVVNRMNSTRMAIDFRIIRANLPQADRDGGTWYKRVDGVGK